MFSFLNMKLDEKFEVLHVVLFNVEELSFWENVAFAIKIALYGPQKSPWSLRKCFYLKDCVFL